MSNTTKRISFDGCYSENEFADEKTSFNAEIKKRFTELSEGKVANLSLKELEEGARKAYKSSYNNNPCKK